MEKSHCSYRRTYTTQGELISTLVRHSGITMWKGSSVVATFNFIHV